MPLYSTFKKNPKRPKLNSFFQYLNHYSPCNVCESKEKAQTLTINGKIFLKLYINDSGTGAQLTSLLDKATIY